MTSTSPNAVPSGAVPAPRLGRRAAPPLDAPDVPGYTVSELVGRGSTGAVWAATRLEDGAPVALKLVPLDAGDPAHAMREADALRGLDLEHVVRLHEVLATEDDVVLVLDLMQGGSLAGVLAARGHLDAGECVTVLTPILTALGRLHRLGIVHGDLSPGNVLFDRNGRPAIGDLGEARVAGAVRQDPGASPGFVAPELLIGEPARPESDVYAVGALGVACLTGRPPSSTLVGQVDDGWDPVRITDAPSLRVLRLCEQAMAPHARDRPDADALSVALFEAAPAAALRLVVDADPTALLTRRIRELARSEEHDEAATHAGARVRERTTGRFTSMTRGSGSAVARSGPGWLGVGRGRLGVGRGRLGVGRGRLLPGSGRFGMSGDSGAPEPERFGTTPWWKGVRSRRMPRITIPMFSRPAWTEPRRLLSIAGACIVLAVLAGLVVAALTSVSSRHSSAWGAEREATVIDPPTPSPGAHQSQQPLAEALRVSAADLDRDPTGVVNALAQVRARLWSDPAAGSLSDLDVIGSPAERQDRLELERAMVEEVVHDGLGLTASDVAVVAGQSSSRTVRVTLTVSAHHRITRDVSRPVPATRAAPVLLDLRLTAQGWRVWAVRPA